MKQTLFSHCCCSDRSRTCYLHLMGVLCNHLHLAAMSLKKPPYPHGLGGTIEMNLTIILINLKIKNK